MRLVFTDRGLLVDYKKLIPFESTVYDDFVYVLQQYGLRNLVENVSQFTVKSEAMIADIRKVVY